MRRVPGHVANQTDDGFTMAAVIRNVGIQSRIHSQRYRMDLRLREQHLDVAVSRGERVIRCCHRSKTRRWPTKRSSRLPACLPGVHWHFRQIDRIQVVDVEDCPRSRSAFEPTGPKPFQVQDVVAAAKLSLECILQLRSEHVRIRSPQCFPLRSPAMPLRIRKAAQVILRRRKLFLRLNHFLVLAARSQGSDMVAPFDRSAQQSIIPSPHRVAEWHRRLQHGQDDPQRFHSANPINRTICSAI